MRTAATAAATSVAEVQSAALEISRIFREAKVDAALRPKALAAILLAGTAPGAKSHEHFPSALSHINAQVAAALQCTNLPSAQRRKLQGALRLAGAEFERLSGFIPRIEDVLRDLGLTALDSGFDLFGIFYETFLRYGYDNNALGIVFTPRHIARFCVELIGVGPDDRVIDIACGTGGFLLAAAERMHDWNPPGQGPALPNPARRTSTKAENKAPAICGFDTNPTVWALALLNMLFRKSPSSRIELGSCFEPQRQGAMRGRFTRGFLNPPFSQHSEPERKFIDATMEALEAGGRCAIVVKAGIFADEEHRRWRAEFMRRHRVLAVISLPEDVFYPTAVPASILLAEAHRQQSDTKVLMARVWNDGFEKLKNRRVEREGCEFPEVKRCLSAMLAGADCNSHLAVAVDSRWLVRGAEWSPQQWLPQPQFSPTESHREQQRIVAAILQAVAEMPELAEVALPDFAARWQNRPPLPPAQRLRVSELFCVRNGRSAGEKQYRDGGVPYVSSSGTMNSIVRLVDAEQREVFAEGGITVTAFGQAAVQPWPLVARGNGGSSVRVLEPRFRMSFAELTWFAAQINAQQWRFFYARMAIKSRLERLMVTTPPRAMPEPRKNIAARVLEWREKLAELSAIEDDSSSR
jgi:type I restriction enzyme M protein